MLFEHLKIFENHAFLRIVILLHFKPCNYRKCGKFEETSAPSDGFAPSKLYCLKYCYSIFRSLIRANLDQKCSKMDGYRFFPDSRSKFFLKKTIRIVFIPTRHSMIGSPERVKIQRSSIPKIRKIHSGIWKL